MSEKVFNERWRADGLDYILTAAALGALFINPIGAIVISGLDLLRFKFVASAARDHKMTNQSIDLLKAGFDLGRKLK